MSFDETTTLPTVQNPKSQIHNCLQPLSIGPIAIGFPVVQAALSGYSDWPMRVMARRHGASYALCEVMLDQFLVTVKENRNRNRHFLQLARPRARDLAIDHDRRIENAVTRVRSRCEFA